MPKFKTGDILIYTGVLDRSEKDFIGKKCKVIELYGDDYAIIFEDGEKFDTCREGNLKLFTKEIKLFEDD